jgi:Fe-S cluster biogenesis protein NfuA
MNDNQQDASSSVNKDEDIRIAVENLLEARINPALSSHGGFVNLVKVEAGDVYLEMGGGCQGCAGARATMRYGVENAIREVVPGVGQVVDATDHAAGGAAYM